MKIRALRGVCIGVDQHLKAGDLADLDTAMVTYLLGIRAVETVPEETVPDASASKPIEPEPPSVREKLGKKEKSS